MGALALLVFILLISQGAEASTQTTSEPTPRPPPPQKPPSSPATAPEAPAASPQYPPALKPWPAAYKPPAGKPKVTPASAPGLPKFPSGWEPDTPPSAAVVARAYALLPELWRSGKPGAIRQEQTDGAWKTYQAYAPAKGKRSVVAYRLKGGGGTVYA